MGRTVWELEIGSWEPVFFCVTPVNTVITSGHSSLTGVEASAERLSAYCPGNLKALLIGAGRTPNFVPFGTGPLCRLFLIQILLEAREGSPDLIRRTQVGDGVGDGVVILEPQQGRELLLIEFLDADTDVMRQHEVEKRLLLAAELCADRDTGIGGARLGVSEMGRTADEVDYQLERARGLHLTVK